jgi:hypothetical protein
MVQALKAPIKGVIESTAFSVIWASLAGGV